MTGTTRTYSYVEARSEIQAIAAVMLELGIAKGDRSSSTCRWCPRPSLPCGLREHRCRPFGGLRGFAAHELATRIDDSQARLIISPPAGSNRAVVVAS